MKKNTIKFPRQYTKLFGQLKGKLLHVEMVSKSKLDYEFIELDTAYTTDGNDRKYYPLPNGLCIVLVFLGNKNIPFTTVLPGRDRNLTRYESTIGEWYELLVEEEREEEEYPQEEICFNPPFETVSA